MLFGLLVFTRITLELLKGLCHEKRKNLLIFGVSGSFPKLFNVATFSLIFHLYVDLNQH